MLASTSSPWTFEGLRSRLDDLSAPAHEDERQAFWVIERKLGIARAPRGQIEIFLVGPKLNARTGVVARHIQHDTWAVDPVDQISANRVVLPAAPHFVAIATLVVIELLRAGLEGSKQLQAVFDDIEPILELALRRGALAEESIVGMVGELLTLEQAIAAVAARPELRLAVLDMWHGYRHGDRDFVIGEDSIEVKTTRLQSSAHHISSLQQVDPEPRGNGTVEHLWLLSIGITQTSGLGFTLPEIVDRILALLDDSNIPVGSVSPLQQRFLRNLREYGAIGGEGYDHQAMSDWGVYRVPLALTFTPRMYDFTDPAVRVIRRADLAGTFVNADDVRYRIDLPDSITSLNPTASWQRSLVGTVRRALRI